MDSAPGFRFHPTDEELVFFYLKRKVSTKSFRFDPVGVVDIYKFEPWDLPSMSKLKTKDLEWYFFTVLDKKYGNGSRTNRATDRGYWKTTGKDRPVKHGNREVGMKKTLVYHLGRAPHGNRTNWVMHEYRLLDEELAEFGALQDPYVLCRIFEKSGSGPKNGEKYGAPLGDKEWENDNVVDPLPVAVDDDDGPLKVVPASAVNATAAAASAVDDDDHLETADLEKELDTSVTIGSAGFPLNFYHGECSSQPVHSQALLNDQKPLEGTFGISWPQPYNMAEQYGVDTNSVKDEDNGELSHNENPLNFNCAFDGLDLSLDAAGDPVIFGDGSYLETNDLLNSVIDDPSGAEMLDEYLKYLDDDVLKYISFDSPQNTGSEIPIDNHGQPSIEQNVEGETSDSTLANKHVFEAQSGNEASSKQNSEAPNLVSDDTNPFVKRAHKLLAGIPAAPAFASEFPTKEFALGLHPAAQPSNSAHVTAGMISITDITFRGNAMDWMVGKNGGFNTIMSTGFSQHDVNSAALVPISGLVCSKTAFVLSHGWIYLMGFSVLILSLTFKIGSFMYTGK